MVYQERIQGTVLGRTLLSVDQYCPGSLKKSLLLGLWSSKVFPTSVGRTKDSRIDFSLTRVFATVQLDLKLPGG